jgi:hypothetical protein
LGTDAHPAHDQCNFVILAVAHNDPQEQRNTLIKIRFITNKTVWHATCLEIDKCRANGGPA